MANSILVPLDGSTFAEHALPVAEDYARRSGARLHLVQVHEPLTLPVNPAGLAAEYAEWEQAMKLQGEEYLRSTAAGCMERSGVAVRTELLEGAPANALATYATELDIGLIVMTTHGRGGISRAWVGSVADALVRRSRVPVLLLRPPTNALAARHALEARHTLIPLDGSDLAAQVIEPAVALATPGRTRFTLLRVLLPRPLLPARARTALAEQALAERERADALEQMETAAGGIRAAGYDVETVIVQDRMPAMAILDHAAENAVDLIAIATRGRGGWSRVALGSVADKVMRGAGVPVLVYRPPAELLAGTAKARVAEFSEELPRVVI